MKLSKATERIEPSLTRQLFDEAKKYSNVIDFTLGDPDYPTPDKIKAAGCKAINDGKTRYSANAGLPELRKVISDRIFKESAVNYNPDGEILISVGAMEGLYLSLLCMIDEGDEVIIPAPYWINYRHMVEMCGGIPIIVESDEEHDFICKAEDIEAAITDKTAAVIINSPNNPTGTVYDRETLKKLSKLAKEKDFAVIWDECYKSIIYDEFVSILEFEDMKDYTVLINSCSKKFSMTGWRVGYVAAPHELIACMTKFQENIVACASLPSQYAAIEAFSADDSIADNILSGFKNRRRVFIDGINKINKLSCKYPKGTFYAFVNIKETGMGSVDFAYRLLESKQVAVVPGITYGECCEGYIRAAYTIDESEITEGLQRISEFIKELG